MRCSGSARAVSMQIGNVGDRLELAGKIEAALAGHHDVEDDDVEGEPAHGGARARRIGGGGDTRKPVLEQIARQQVADALVVVDDQDVRGVVG